MPSGSTMALAEFHSFPGTPASRRKSSHVSNPSGGSCSRYPSALAQNRPRPSGSAQSKVTWNRTLTRSAIPPYVGQPTERLRRPAVRVQRAAQQAPGSSGRVVPPPAWIARLAARRVLRHHAGDRHGGAVPPLRVEAQALPLPGAGAVRRIDLRERERPPRPPRDVPHVLHRPRPDAVTDRWTA